MTKRQTTPVDKVANQLFDAIVDISPISASWLGIDQHQTEYDDLSPQGLDALDATHRAALAAVDQLTPVDDVDAVTISALKERIALTVETHARGADLMNIAGLATGLHDIREVFDIMPTDTSKQWATIAARLQATPSAIDGWFASQLAGIESGTLPASRQVDLLAEQCRGWAGEDGFFAAMLKDAAPTVDVTTGDALENGVATARAAFAGAADRLASQIRPLATNRDAVGPKRYELASRQFLGLAVDAEEYYRWGLDEVARLDAASVEIAAKLRPSLSVAATKQALDDDPAYQLDGCSAMRNWMQGKADEAIAALNGRHFDIPEPARRIECKIAGIQDGGIWYTAPSDDFARPGRMWWSVPKTQTQFLTWRELTTVYHEGVPGHHLQIAQAVYERELLNKWRRHMVFVSGHGEGWALYAEQLMAELGYLDDPAAMLGMLDSQSLRAVRVVIDMGLHCGFDAPAEVGGGEWTFDKAWRFFNSHVQMDEGQARFEVLRYFGWPGQAPSYKIGQRVWLEIRDACQRRDGEAFSLKDFHAKALNLGSVGLGTLKEAMLC